MENSSLANLDDLNALNDKAKKIVKSTEPKVLTFLEQATEKIKSCINDIRQNFFTLGVLLSALKYSEDIKTVFNWKLGRECKNVYEYAEQEFRFSKSTTKNLIGIVKRFGNLNSSLKKEYEPYLYSQLCEMLPLTSEQLELVSPDMTEREIRALKKVGVKQNSEVGQLTGQNSEIEEKAADPLGYYLKNDEQRLDFVRNYTRWRLWLHVPELNLKFYRCDLNNGDYLLVTEYTRFKVKSTYYGDEYYCGLNDKFVSDNYNFFKCIVKKGTSPNSYGYDHIGIGDTDFLNYMKSTKARVMINPAEVLSEQ